MDASAFRRMIVWNLIAAAIAVALAFFFVHQKSEHSGLNARWAQDLAVAKHGFETLEAGDTRLLSASLEALLRDDRLRDAYLSRDRKRLYALAQPIFTGLKARYGITHFYFLDPPPSSTCFLRVHSPQLHGDKIDRATYRLAVQDKGFGSGKELGQTAFALRVVHPWMSKDGKRVIGYLELGEEIGHFLGQLKQQTGDDFALLLDKRKLDSVVWMHMRNANGLPNDWGQRALYVLAQDTGVAVRDLEWNGSLDKLPEEGRVLGLQRVQGRSVMRGVFAVKDAEGQRAGAVLVARDVTQLLRHSQWRHVLSVALVLAALLILGLLIGWVLAQPELEGEAQAHSWARPFRGLSKALAKLFRGA